jgi:hypothetical protein
VANKTGWTYNWRMHRIKHNGRTTNTARLEVGEQWKTLKFIETLEIS